MKQRKHKYANGGQVRDYSRGSSSPNSPGLMGAVKDAVKAVGDYTSNRAARVPDRDRMPVKGRTLRQKQLEDLGE